MKIEGNKYINTWTGNNCSSPQSLQETTEKNYAFWTSRKNI